MPQDYILPVAILVFFVSIILSRFIIMSAIKQLTDEEKSRLLSNNLITGSQTRLLIVFGVLGIYYFAIVKYPQYAKEMLTAFVVIIIIIRIITFINTRKKLQNLSLPEPYIKAFSISSLIYNIGIMAFFLILMQNYL